MNAALSLRQALLSSDNVEFKTKIVADFGDELSEFWLECSAVKSGDISFSVISPESISGISGKINAAGGGLTFDDKVLAFPLIIEESISPISAPWILLNCLRSGYITACGSSDGGLQLIIDDSLMGKNVQCILWLNDKKLPYYSEIIWDSSRVLSLNIESFVIS